MSHSSESGESDDGGDDQEGSSFSDTNVEDALTSFREQWQRELNLSPKRDIPKAHSSKTVKIDVACDEDSIENMAKHFFLKGIEYERSRKFYEAIQSYKRAVQLVPDIEFRLYDSSKLKSNDDSLEDLNNIVNNVDDNNENCNDEDEEESDLFIKLCKIINDNKCVCLPKFEQNTTHISALPIEIVLYILRWVVSSELDLRSLEMFSSVCRGFYISARDTEIWRLACIRVWGVNCGTYTPKYQSWREMYLQRPRLRYDGCYICKISYIREGENSFQDRFYRPWYLLEYFRYLRFFPEGKVLMLTSTDEPQNCVNSLKTCTPRNPSVIIGQYRLHGNCVILVFKQQKAKEFNDYSRKKREPVHDLGEQTFRIEFNIQNHLGRMNSQLKWLSYTMFTKYRDGHVEKSYLKKPPGKEWRVSGIDRQYPPFKFSRVKSYTHESEAPLQLFLRSASERRSGH
ncbi:F-box only protein 9 isoform X1 [Colletes gigas]|uniref:F-box only protein 9 isoform X1 n=2 Tax=Colletes gigas TaxID=935657 RepID=UPI001C9A549A|nr:F-box only protein 9 isoform X1 [Colletes gigas]